VSRRPLGRRACLLVRDAHGQQVAVELPILVPVAGRHRPVLDAPRLAGGGRAQPAQRVVRHGPEAAVGGERRGIHRVIAEALRRFQRARRVASQAEEPGLAARPDRAVPASSDTNSASPGAHQPPSRRGDAGRDTSQVSIAQRDVVAWSRTPSIVKVRARTGTKPIGRRTPARDASWIAMPSRSPSGPRHDPDT
jgi:hypothetical protein